MVWRASFSHLAGTLAIVLGLAAIENAAWADRAQAKYWFERGVTLEASGEHAEALACYERTIDADVDHQAAYQHATRLWIELQSFDSAIARLERYTLRHPNRAFAWYALAYAYRRKARWEHAVLAYESYVDLRPDEPAGYFGLGVARLEIGDREGARAAFTGYLARERDPARAEFVAQAEQQLATLGEHAPAGPDASASIDLGPADIGPGADAADAADAEDERQSLTLLLISARSAITRGRVAEARRLLLALLAATPTHIEAYRLLAALP